MRNLNIFFIYIKIDFYYKNHPEIWDDDMEIMIQNEEILEIRKNIIALLSLPTMDRFMQYIRTNPFYKWIWDFY